MMVLYPIYEANTVLSLTVLFLGVLTCTAFRDLTVLPLQCYVLGELPST